ncbi:MAG: NAD(P)(+) transhydrogenase (Re/Si-specific) subunit beta [Treponema sp.]
MIDYYSIAYYVISAVLSLGVLIGISMMSKVKTARLGNALSALCMLIAIAVVFVFYGILSVYQVWIGLGIGLVVGLMLTIKVDMISMPQTVALLNGLGGAASAVVGFLTLINPMGVGMGRFVLTTSAIAVVVGSVTFSGSLIAAGKLHRVLKQQPVVLPMHQMWTSLCLIISLAFIAFFAFAPVKHILSYLVLVSIVGTLISLIFGVIFAIRVGGADMPITISLLNSTSGVAAAIAGMATRDILTVSVGGIVGASGLLLTQIMCRAMNRSLSNILFSKGAKVASPAVAKAETVAESTKTEVKVESNEDDLTSWLKEAKNIIIVPGYGMAVSQAQSRVKMLADKLEGMGKNVRFAIHPVAGRMPGHMNVLLCEVDIPYEKLYEMEAINGDFEKTDLVIIIGASDVVNPAANTAEGTPIYGMPILEAGKGKHIIICNFDLKPGYAGVPNPLYEMKDKVHLLLGDAKDSIDTLLSKLQATSSVAKAEVVGGGNEDNVSSWVKEAKNIIIVPGYGMAVSQAQSRVKMLADKLEGMGKNVRFAIHPVAGRMPGHMNVLLCEVDIPYEKLYEMEAINGDFEKTDLVIIIGASDVVNPAANTAEGTPIYGMPILEAGKGKHIIICNFDLKPGYAGVPNPLYEMKDKVHLLLGDAKDSIDGILSKL